MNRRFRVAAMKHETSSPSFEKQTPVPALVRTDKTECTASSVVKSQLVYLRIELVLRDERLSNLAAVYVWLHVPLLVVQPSSVPVI